MTYQRGGSAGSTEGRGGAVPGAAGRGRRIRLGRDLRRDRPPRVRDTWTAIAELLEPADPDQALAALETALSHDPYNEYLYQRFMRIQAAAGRPDAVRRTLRLLETRLTELGLTPAAQTRQAAATLLGSPGSPQRM